MSNGRVAGIVNIDGTHGGCEQEVIMEMAARYV